MLFLLMGDHILPEFSLFHPESKFKTNFNIDTTQINVTVSYGKKQLRQSIQEWTMSFLKGCLT